MKTFQIIALTAPGFHDPGIAIAASRAGELGVLDLEYATDREVAFAAVAALAKGAHDQQCGIKLNGGEADWVSWLLPRLPDSVATVILTTADARELKQQVEAFHRKNIAVLYEVTSLDQAIAAVAAKINGFIVKGNEAGGRVGEDTTFVLLQKIVKLVSIPVWAHGGIGMHTAPAVYAAGAAGIVLDWQLALARESTLPEPIKSMISRMDGSETRCLGNHLGCQYRVFAKPENAAVKALIAVERGLGDQHPADEVSAIWQREVRARAGCRDQVNDLLLFGQDGSFAHALSQRYKTVGGILTAIRASLSAHLVTVRTSQPFQSLSPLAQAHGTLYPIVQGPMARISDKAAFLSRVAEEGALPFFAMGMSQPAELEKNLQETQRQLAGRPWGVGLLGFAPAGVYKEHTALIEKFKPPFALIAGGNPEQAQDLELKGVATYLHVPSPGLLEIFLAKGVRRFIFEGRECGGHIGPRSSFVLWNQAIDVLTGFLPEQELPGCHVLFAGGIHDALSSAMVAALSAPLVARGVKVGLQLGTAYLFTHEAVTTGALVEAYQHKAIECDKTVILETAPGHASRCIATPYVDLFNQRKRELVSQNRPVSEINAELEKLNLGRLRIAAKGIDRDPRCKKGIHSEIFVQFNGKEQHAEGMYMIGQVATMRDQALSIKELHRELAENGSRLLKQLNLPEAAATIGKGQRDEAHDIAIIGMGCLFPKASEVNTYWENIVNKVDAITEIPPDRWDWKQFYDQDPQTRDKVYSRWGGFLTPVPFDPVRYGMPPDAVKSIEPVQLLGLEVVRAALMDAGYEDRDFPRENTSVIFGAGSSMSDLGQNYILRSNLPGFLGDAPEHLFAQLPEWSSDSFAGILPNVIAGRIANRFNLGGVNHTVDAACASSLAAVYHAVKELVNHTSDMVIAGGADTFQSPFAYFCFSKTLALSPTGKSRAFDEKADGTCISEGVAAVVLKRLSDAVRDGDRVYAVIKGVGGSSDGKCKGITAPNLDGQIRALRRAYDDAGYPSATVELIEAHGTGTAVGDAIEIQALITLFQAEGVRPQHCALGSVKSMIGHTKCTAGLAGLIKTALALHHKVFPPTLGINRPRECLAGSPCYVNTETRPWIKSHLHPRRAGVSCFGFGGTNFHVAVEEYADDFPAPKHQAIMSNWPSEILLWKAASREEHQASLGSLLNDLQKGACPALKDLSYSLWENAKKQTGSTLAIVAASLDDLREKLGRALGKLNDPGVSLINDPAGIYYTSRPLAPEGETAFLFPGQGSQYPYMLRDLAIYFSEIGESFEKADQVLRDRLPDPLATYVFPPPVFSEKERTEQKKKLSRTTIAQPAIGASGLGLFKLLASFGVRPDMVAGHSYGEYAALCAAGVYCEDTLYQISEARGRLILEEAGHDRGTMAAVESEPERISGIVASIDNVWISNRNSPQQTVISGSREGIDQAVMALQQAGITVRPVPVSCAFHSPLVAPVKEKLADFFQTIEFSKPELPVFSNTSAAIYPSKPEEISALLCEHLVTPVRFVDEIQAMYKAGARIFLEVGPKRVLTNLTRQILGDHPHLALPMDAPDTHGLVQLEHLLAQLAIHNVPVDLDRLYSGRAVRLLTLNALTDEGKTSHSSTTFWVDGGKAWSQSAKNREKPRGVPSGEGQKEEPASKYHQPNSGTMSQPIGSSAANDARYQILLNHQRLMQQFLETQQQIMLAFLNGPGSAGMDDFARLPPKRTFEELMALTGGSVAPQRSNLAVSEHKGLGVAVQPLGAGVATSAPITSAPANVRKDLPPTLDDGLIKQELIRIVGERTGYPPEMLDLNLDLEADLGVDSIKRTEILGVIQKKYPELMEGDSERIGELSRIKTLQGIIDLLAQAAQSYPKDQQPVIPDGTKALDAGMISEELIRIVGERTGYPPEMLDLNLDLEADLGVDSIKRTEILGVIQKKYPELMEGDSERIGELSKIKTLQGIINLLAQSAGKTTGGENLSAALPQKTVEAFIADRGGEHEQTKIARYVLQPVEAPLENRSFAIPEGLVFIITCSKGEMPFELAARITELGGRPVLIRNDAGLEVLMEGVYQADLTDSTTLSQCIDTIRGKYGAIGGIIHLLSTFSDKQQLADMPLADWRKQLQISIKSLFCLAKAVAQDLEQSAGSGGGWLVAAVAGVNSADGEILKLIPPGYGGLSGMVKTIAEEWPEVACKFVVHDGEVSSPAFINSLLHEMADRFGEVAVGYAGQRRFMLRTRLNCLACDTPLQIEIQPDWVLLITGGARGITAQVALELARRKRPTLILLGRAPLPTAEEDAATAGMTAESEIKKALIDQERKQGREVKLSEVETAYRNLLRDREIRANLEQMKNAGATIRYLQADVRDEEAFSAAIAQVYQDFGRLDGVIHGAGIIEDKLLKDKQPDSFDRVFDTKADGAFNLSRAIKGDSLKFLVFFTSIAGSFGNRGQSDYAAANETINKLALQLAGRWPGRIIAANWGPWDKSAGMVSTGAQEQFARRGVQLIPVEAGCRALIEEIEFGPKVDVEVIFGDGPWASAPALFPLLTNTRQIRSEGGTLEVMKTFDLKTDLFLRDHVLDNKPVVPVTFIMELMAEVAQHGWIDHVVTEISSFQFFKGVIFDADRRTIRIVAKPAEGSAIMTAKTIAVEITEPDKPKIPLYRGVVHLMRRPLSTVAFDSGRFSGLPAFPMTLAQAYRKWLFHGPCFQHIIGIEGMSNKAICGIIKPSSTDVCLAGGPAEQWLFDPVVLDASFQLVLLWERAHHDMTSLPSRIASLRCFGPFPRTPVRCCILAESSNNGQHVVADIYFVDASGRLVGSFEKAEFTSSAALNRLCGLCKCVVKDEAGCR